MGKLLSKKLTTLLAALLFAAACFSLGWAFMRHPAKAESVFDASLTLESSYEQGEVVSIPQGSFKVGDDTVTAESYVVLPSGAKKRTDGFTLEETGKYTVIYTATVNGETLTEEKTFMCYARKSSVDALNATIAYEDRAFINYGKTDETTASGYQETVIGGLDVKLTQNATFYYNSIIDVSGYDGTKPFFTYYSTAIKNNYPVWLMLTVRLTDVYDPDNYIEILFDKYGSLNLDSKMPAYFRARVGEQPSMGLNGTQLKKDYYGCWTPASWDYTQATTGNQVDKSIGFYLDYEGKKVYNYLGKLVADLASTSYFAEPWQGFTTGEVYLSVYASEFNDSEGNIFITNIGGDTGATLGEKYLQDTDAPIISVDYDTYAADKLPTAVVGQPYQVFAANAIDFYSGVKSLQTNVYYNYHSAERVNVTLDGDTFVPKYEGAYTIEYVAEDRSGNKRTLTVGVTAVKQIGSGLNVYTVGEEQTSGFVARNIPIAEYAVENASGNYRVEITATKGDSVYEINAETLLFNVKQEGSYTITYTVTDYVGCKDTYSYTLEVTPDNDPVFLNELIMPKYLLAGCNQVLPTLVAYDYKQGGAEVKTKISVQADGLPVEQLDSNVFAPAMKYVGKTVTITYTAQTATGSSSQTYTSECVSILKDETAEKTPAANISGNIQKTSLFVTSESVVPGYGKVTEKDTSEYAQYTFSENGTLAYVNPLLASKFAIQFNITKGNFGILNVYMTDVEDKTQRAKYTLINRNTYVGFKLNDGIEYRLNKQSFNKPQESFNIEYNWQDAEILFENGDTAFSLTNDGSKYFTSGKIYFEMEMLEVTGESKIVIQKVRNQMFTASARDNGAPEGTMLGEYKRNYDLGSVVELYDFVGGDAIDPTICEVKMWAQYQQADGSFTLMQDVGGEKIDGVDPSKGYRIQLNAFGSYKITYEVTNGNSYDFMLNVKDFKDPEVTWTYELADEYKVGDTITLSATATDECTDEMKLYYTVKTVKGIIVFFNEASEYTFTEKGEYVVYAYTYDGNENYGFVRKTITVI